MDCMGVTSDPIGSIFSQSNSIKMMECRKMTSEIVSEKFYIHLEIKWLLVSSILFHTNGIDMIFITWYTCLISYDTLNGIECLILWERVLLILWELPDYRYNNYDFDSDLVSPIPVFQKISAGNNIFFFLLPAEIFFRQKQPCGQTMLWYFQVCLYIFL